MSEGNRALENIEARGIDARVAELTDPERRALQPAEIDQLSARMPEWQITTITQEGTTSTSFTRYMPSSPDNQRALGNARARVEHRFDANLGIELGDVDGELIQVVVELIDGPVTPRTFRALNALDQQLAGENAFGQTDF